MTFKKNHAFKVLLVRFDYKDLSVSGPEEPGSIVTYENRHFSTKNYETKSSKLVGENEKSC